MIAAGFNWIAFVTAGGVLLYIVAVTLYWKNKKRKR